MPATKENCIGKVSNLVYFFILEYFLFYVLEYFSRERIMIAFKFVIKVQDGFFCLF